MNTKYVSKIAVNWFIYELVFLYGIYIGRQSVFDFPSGLSTVGKAGLVVAATILAFTCFGIQLTFEYLGNIIRSVKEKRMAKQ